MAGHLIFSSPYINLFKPKGDSLLELVVEETELFDFMDDYLTEVGDIKIECYQQNDINNIPLYRFFISLDQENKLLHLLEKLDLGEIETLWKLNNNIAD